ncbi:MAG TPA: hypothetical protein VIK91_11130 [Nannocystis sp.]
MVPRKGRDCAFSRALSTRDEALAAVFADVVVGAALLPGGVGDVGVVGDGVDVEDAVFDGLWGVVEGEHEDLGLEGVEGLGRGQLADLVAVGGVAGVEADDDAGGEGGFADVADGGDEGVVVALAERGDGDDGVGGAEFVVGLAVLAEVVEVGDGPVGLLGERDRAVLVDIGDVVYKRR